MARHNPGLIEYILPEDTPQEDEDFIEFYSQFNLMLTPVAFVMSYYRNKSLKWAAIHTLLAAPYVAYVLVDVLAREEARELVKIKKGIEAKTHKKVSQAVDVFEQQTAFANPWDEWDYDE